MIESLYLSSFITKDGKVSTSESHIKSRYFNHKLDLLDFSTPTSLQ